MKDDDRSMGSSSSNNLFVVPDSSAMGSDVSDAAKILRSFVSRVGDAVQEEPGMFPAEEKAEESDAMEEAEPKKSDIDDYIASASDLSQALSDAPRITPRLITPSVDGISSVPVQATDVQLVYKGKASKKQLERLRKRVMQQAESRSSLRAVSQSWDGVPGK